MHRTVPPPPSGGNRNNPFADNSESDFKTFSQFASPRTRSLAFHLAPQCISADTYAALSALLHGSQLLVGSQSLREGNALGVNIFITANPTDPNSHAVTSTEALVLGFEHQHHVEALPLPPTLIVEERPGWSKCWWLLERCNLTKSEHDAVLATLVDTHGASPGSGGWDTYHLFPGFRVNCTGKVPHLVRIVGGTLRSTPCNEIRAAYLDPKVRRAAAPAR